VSYVLLNIMMLNLYSKIIYKIDVKVVKDNMWVTAKIRNLIYWMHKGGQQVFGDKK